MLSVKDAHNAIRIDETALEDRKGYFTVSLLSVPTNRVKTHFTVTKGELETLITALIMLKEHLANTD